MPDDRSDATPSGRSEPGPDGPLPDGSRPEAGPQPSVQRVPASLLDSDLAELEGELRQRRRAARRHTMWAVLGVSPGAVLPLVLSVGQAGTMALLAGVITISGVEAWRAVRADREARVIAEELERLSGPAAE